MRSDLPLDFPTIGKFEKTGFQSEATTWSVTGEQMVAVIGGRSRPSVRLLSDHAVCDHHGRKRGCRPRFDRRHREI